MTVHTISSEGLMTRPKHKRPRPPKEWYPSGKEMPRATEEGR